MSLQPLPQFTDEYEGEKIRYLVQVLENALNDFTTIDQFIETQTIVYPQYSTKGNVGSAETTLFTGNVVPSKFFNPGWQIIVQAFGTFASNNNAKELKLYLNNVVIYDSTALIVNSGTWSIEALIIVTGSSSEQILITTISSNVVLPTTAIYSAGTVLMGTTNTITLTATGVATNDIVGQGMILTTQPN